MKSYESTSICYGRNESALVSFFVLVVSLSGEELRGVFGEVYESGCEMRCWKGG